MEETLLTPTRRTYLIQACTIIIGLASISLCSKRAPVVVQVPLQLEWRVQPGYSWFQDYRYTLDVAAQHTAHYQAVLTAGKETRRKQGELNAQQTQALLNTLQQLPLDGMADGSKEPQSSDEPTYSIRLVTPAGSRQDRCYGMPGSRRKRVHESLYRAHPGKILHEFERQSLPIQGTRGP